MEKKEGRKENRRVRHLDGHLDEPTNPHVNRFRMDPTGEFGGPSGSPSGSPFCVSWSIRGDAFGDHQSFIRGSVRPFSCSSSVSTFLRRSILNRLPDGPPNASVNGFAGMRHRKWDVRGREEQRKGGREEGRKSTREEGRTEGRKEERQKRREKGGRRMGGRKFGGGGRGARGSPTGDSPTKPKNFSTG